MLEHCLITKKTKTKKLNLPRTRKNEFDNIFIINILNAKKIYQTGGSPLKILHLHIVPAILVHIRGVSVPYRLLLNNLNKTLENNKGITIQIKGGAKRREFLVYLFALQLITLFPLPLQKCHFRLILDIILFGRLGKIK